MSTFLAQKELRILACKFKLNSQNSTPTVSLNVWNWHQSGYTSEYTHLVKLKFKVQQCRVKIIGGGGAL